MDKWTKTILISLAIFTGCLLIKLLFGLDLIVMSLVAIMLIIYEVICTATDGLKNKWGGFGIRISIMFVVILLFGMLIGASNYNTAKLWCFILFIDLLTTTTKKDKHKEIHKK